VLCCAVLCCAVLWQWLSGLGWLAGWLADEQEKSLMNQWLRKKPYESKT
jgi:hypothetical protein